MQGSPSQGLTGDTPQGLLYGDTALHLLYNPLHYLISFFKFLVIYILGEIPNLSFLLPIQLFIHPFLFSSDHHRLQFSSGVFSLLALYLSFAFPSHATAFQSKSVLMS